MEAAAPLAAAPVGPALPPVAPGVALDGGVALDSGVAAPGRGLRVRRAGLADVPALARLLEPPLPVDLPDERPVALPVALPARRPDLSREVLASALRLTLAHVGIDRGEVWVAVDDGERVVSGLAVLPPRHTRSEAALLLALRLELRLELAALLGPARPDEAGPARREPGEADPGDAGPGGAGPGGVEPEQGCRDHWFLLPVAADLPAVDVLLHRALQGVDRHRAPVATAAYGPLHVDLPTAGFRPVAACAGEVLVRDARPTLPVQAGPRRRWAGPPVT